LSHTLAYHFWGSRTSLIKESIGRRKILNIDKKYVEIFNHIKNVLNENNKNATKLNEKFPFRIRSEHIWRVFIWANRLTESDKYKNINKDALFVGSLFHDVGYAISPKSIDHAQNSEVIFREYCIRNNITKKPDEDFIAYLIRNHSNKELMENRNTPIELIILMEADILDETGTMSIVWDCMAEGNKEEQNYKKTFDHINENSYKILEGNPMITEEGKRYWKNKQELIRNFVKEYAFDLGIENTK
jgi:uncharacterized protein